MEDLSELLQPIIDFVLGNIGIVIFLLFLLSGFIGRGNKNDAQQEADQQQRRQRQAAGEHDDRPLAERLAEAFGVEIPEEQRQQSQRQQQTRPQNYASDVREGRRSTSRRSVQENYPELFGGSSIFEDAPEEETKWGFDENEWGTTFERNEEQWGSSFPDRKDSEPRIDFPR